MKIKLETSPWESDFETVQDYIAAIKKLFRHKIETYKYQTKPWKTRCSNNMLKFSLGKIRSKTKHYANKICGQCQRMV